MFQTLKIAFDYTTAESSSLRDSATTDQNGLSPHANTDLSSYALNQWYHRKMAIIGDHVGETIENYDIVTEQNSAGTYTGYLDNILINT